MLKKLALLAVPSTVMMVAAQFVLPLASVASTVRPPNLAGNSPVGIALGSPTNTTYGADDVGRSVAVIPSDIPPDPPTDITFTSSGTQATFTWNNIPSDGPATLSQVIHAYGLSSLSAHEPSETSRTDCSGSPCTVTGLTVGLVYYFDIANINAAGEGPLSETLGPVTPIGLLGSPTITSVTRYPASAQVAWIDGASIGSAITTWTVYVYSGSTLVTTKTDCSGSPCTVTGLTNGTSYTFKVSEVNDAGEGALSAASSEITPADAPSAPDTPSVTSGNSSLRVRWTQPAANGATITSYTATANPSSETCTYVVVSPEIDTCTITGLTNGTAYTVTVIATNEVGASSPSGQSGPVYPERSHSFTIYPSATIVEAGTTVSAVVSGAPSSANMKVRLAGASTTCTTSAAGQCLVTVTAKSSLASPKASCGSGATKRSVTASWLLAVPSIDLPARSKHQKPLSVTISSALPDSKVKMILSIAGSSARSSARVSSTGTATIALTVPNQSGLARLSVSDAGVTVASGSLLVS